MAHAQRMAHAGPSNVTRKPSKDDKPILEGLCVDASCIENPGKMEYRSVDIKTGKIIFDMKYEEATNNIGEFLAIVHALALYKRNGKDVKSFIVIA